METFKSDFGIVLLNVAKLRSCSTLRAQFRSKINKLSHTKHANMLNIAGELKLPNSVIEVWAYSNMALTYTSSNC